MNTFVFTVTLYSRYKDEATKKTEYKRNVYYDCYFGTVTAEKTSGNRASDSSTFVCRIPEKVTINPDDVIVKGEVSDVVEDAEGKRIADLVQKYKGQAFYVREVSDNTVLPHFPHIRASGKA